MREPTAGMRGVHSELDLLIAHLDEVLESASCPYYLAYGTALGAVRHHDFIPWDVDADVHIKREDYARALSALRDSDDQDFELLAPGDPHYEYLFGRLAKRGVHHTVLRVDLFPLDRAPQNARLRRLYLATTRLLAQAFMVRVMPLQERRHYSASKRAVARTLRAALIFAPPTWILRACERLRSAVERHASGDIVINIFGSYGSREFLKAEWFRTQGHLQFRGKYRPVPCEYDAYLRQIYGDYERVPPDPVIEETIRFAEANYVQPLVDLDILSRRTRGEVEG